jgi:hypothetical protein
MTSPLLKLPSAEHMAVGLARILRPATAALVVFLLPRPRYVLAATLSSSLDGAFPSPAANGWVSNVPTDYRALTPVKLRRGVGEEMRDWRGGAWILGPDACLVVVKGSYGRTKRHVNTVSLTRLCQTIRKTPFTP